MVAHIARREYAKPATPDDLLTTPGLDSAPKRPSSQKALTMAALSGRPLTARERECLAWSAEGKTAWETGVILGISDQTVISHLRNAQRKMRAANRVQAVAMAIRAGLLDDIIDVSSPSPMLGAVVVGDPSQDDDAL